MSVSARNNDHGSYSYKENSVITTTKVRANDGEVTTSQIGKAQVVHTCVRSAKIRASYSPKTSFNIMFRTPTSYERTVRDSSLNSGVWESQSTGTTYSRITVEGDPDIKASWSMVACAPLCGSSVLIDGNLRNRARTECLLKLKDAKAELGESIGQARQTVRMLATRTRDLAFYLSLAKKGQWGRIPKSLPYRFGKNGRATKAPANFWLEIQYGWLPLMKEIFSLYELAQEKARAGSIVRVAREVFDYQSFDRKNIYPGWESSARGRRSHKCVLYAVVDNDKVRNFNRTGVLSPATPWQLTKLSFVVDWLVPISNFLEALTANWGVEFLGGYDSQWCEYGAEARLLPTGGYEELVPRSVDLQVFSYKRQRLAGFPAPVPYIKSPFSYGHATAAIALVHSLAFK